jgi:hypothetical protein
MKSQREVRGSDQKWSWSHRGREHRRGTRLHPLDPADRGEPNETENTRSERSNHQIALFGGRYEEQATSRKLVDGGIAEEANASGKARG